MSWKEEIKKKQTSRLLVSIFEEMEEDLESIQDKLGDEINKLWKKNTTSLSKKLNVTPKTTVGVGYSMGDLLTDSFEKIRHNLEFRLEQEERRLLKQKDESGSNSANIPEELRRRTPRRKPEPYMSSADLRMNE